MNLNKFTKILNIFCFGILLLISPTICVISESSSSSSKLASNLAQINTLRQQPTINQFTKKFFFNPKLKSCDILITETLSFEYKAPTNMISHYVISKQNPIYGVKVSMSEDKIANIRHFTVFQVKTYESRDGELNNSQWLITTILDRQITKTTLEYSYYSQNVIKPTDNDKDINNVKVFMTNPYPFDLTNVNIELLMLNMDKLKPSDIQLPGYTEIVKYIGNSIQSLSSNVRNNNKPDTNEGFIVKFEKNLPMNNEFVFDMELPMDIKTCSLGIINFVSYTMIIMTAAFVIMALASIYVISKE